jgi:large subunit ribosomal protein L30
MAKKTTKPQVKMLRITQVKSAIGYSVKHKATIRALGFHRMHETVTHPDTPTLRGMLMKVNHLVVIEEQDPQ